MNNQLYTIKETANRYNLSLWSLYQNIRSNPEFPVVNIGPHKNYRIDRREFEIWLEERTYNGGKGKFYIPTIEELVRQHKSRGNNG